MVHLPAQDGVILPENTPGVDLTLSYGLKAQTLGSLVDFRPFHLLSLPQFPHLQNGMIVVPIV